MGSNYIEVKSALWQKLLVCFITLIICWGGVFTCLLLFQTPPRSGMVTPPTPVETILCILVSTGLISFGLGLALAVSKYSIRADSEGIRQTNGFFSQSVRWSDVARYYVEPNRRFHSEQRSHIEPVMLNAEGRIIFQGFAHLFVSTKKIIQQRRELWQFVEAQLQGKKSEPDPKSDPKILALQSTHVDWSKKSLLWKIGRISALILYALFWSSLFTIPTYYISINDVKFSPYWGYLIAFMMFFGPLLPFLIRLEIKSRKIAKERKRLDESPENR